LADRESDRITAEKRGVLKVARNALQKNMSISDIVEITGLTRAEIEELREAD